VAAWTIDAAAVSMRTVTEEWTLKYKIGGFDLKRHYIKISKQNI
jgi:hypothetical protein